MKGGTLFVRQQLMHLRFGNRRKIREKICDGMTAIQVIEQRLDGYAGPDKARRPAHDLGVNGDDAGFHADKLAGGPLLARIDSRRSPSDFVDGHSGNVSKFYPTFLDCRG